jgi:hypothetical protein
MNNKLYTWFWILLLITSISAKAGEIKYRVADIPRILKENARSVVRNEEIVLNVKSISKATVNVTYAITILNKNGLVDADFTEVYDKFSKISEIRGRIFDENGEQIKKIPRDEILDYSAISGFSIYESNRVKYIDPKFRNFPFTIEYTYEKSWDGLFSFPSWTPQTKFNVSVEKSSYKAIVPKSINFRYKEQNISTKVIQTSDAESNLYYWEVKNLKALESEPYSVPNQEIFPKLIAAPADFKIEDFQGNMTCWENFGKFISLLNEGKNVLNDELKKQLNDLVAGTPGDYEKVKKIYEYMQSRTRYVIIQIGIGGWQPFDAATVHRLSYGDCKALSNYMKTMLEAVGIKSCYCLVNAGGTAPPMIKDFPSSQFNHAFLCVPMKNDTLWLECTSQRVPCGYLGDFTDNRDVLLIDNEKSKVVHTKKYSSKENLETHNSHLKINEDGSGSAEICNSYIGLRYSNILPTYLADDADKKRKISDRMKFPNFQILNFKYKENKSIIPSVEENLRVNFQNYLTSMNDRYFISLNYSNRIENAPCSMRSRKTDIFIRRSSIDVDTTFIELPPSLKPENLPNPITITNKFGGYNSKIEYSENQLRYIRNFELNEGKYPAAEYTDFVDFFDKIASADARRCALIKK